MGPAPEPLLSLLCQGGRLWLTPLYQIRSVRAKLYLGPDLQAVSVDLRYPPVVRRVLADFHFAEPPSFEVTVRKADIPSARSGPPVAPSPQSLRSRYQTETHTFTFCRFSSLVPLCAMPKCVFHRFAKIVRDPRGRGEPRVASSTEQSFCLSQAKHSAPRVTRGDGAFFVKW